MMKKTFSFRSPLLILFVFQLFLLSIAKAQNNDGDTSRKPFITPIAKPFGDISNAKIDNKGGRLKSADGGLEVIVPENALDSTIAISIQSSHNDLNENDEGAYQLEPSGIQFKKPLRLIFHYKDANANSDLKNIAWQDDKGQWHQLKKISVDTTQKIVSCFALHFSRWAQFSQIYLTASSNMVRVNRTVALHVRSFEDLKDAISKEVSSLETESATSESSTPGSDDDLLFGPTPKKLPHYYTGEWTVNGNVNGRPEVGFVTKQDNRKAIYTAPATVPDNNPVAVSVQIYSDDKKKKLLLTSNITVIGGKYHFTYIHIDEGDGCFALVDSSSCIVNLDADNPSITNIINYPPWSDWPNCSKGCRTEWTNKETVKGLVEINGLASSVITPLRNQGGVTNVNISLVPAMGNTASAIEHCKDGDHTIPSKPYPADPKYINFDIIDRDNVTIHFGGKSGTNELVVQGHNEKTMIYMYRVN